MSSCRNIMLTVAYDGSAYHGWQVQPNGLTVQELMETALEKLTGRSHRILCAGRTDAGVHALGQVVSFRTESTIPPTQFRRGLQRYLPDDITIIESREVHPDFHATRSAVRKRYRYLLWDGPVLPPFLRRYVWRPRRPPELAPMRQALPDLIGTHDFRCFETNYPNKATSIRTIFAASIERRAVPDFLTGSFWSPRDARPHESPEHPLIVFEVEADGFLYNMVRTIVGTLLRIGHRHWPPAALSEIIRSQNRGRAGSTAPACGLYLVRVDYPPELLKGPPDSTIRTASG